MSADQISEFLYADPDTGVISAMIADGDGFRPAMAHEVSSDMRQLLASSGTQHGPAALSTTPSTLSHWAHDQLDQFCARFEHAFCLDQPELEAWDDPAQGPVPGM